MSVFGVARKIEISDSAAFENKVSWVRIDVV
jgi:hypothetical protein